MRKRIVTENKIVTVETTVTEVDRVVAFEDILESVCVSVDDWHNETPWDSCDGWEHDVRDATYDDHDDIKHSRGHAGPNRYNRCSRIITIDDDTITKKWGIDGYSGCSKQVRAELIASAKRVALDQLVKWYSYGWEWYQVCGDHEGYTASLCGIDCPDYAETVRSEIAEEIAGQMEDDDYIVTGKPVHSNGCMTPAGLYRVNREYRQKSYIVKTA